MKLTPEQQKLLVSLLLSDYSLYARAKPALRPEYFDASLQPTIKYIEDYTNRYSVLPLTDQINVDTGMDFRFFPQIADNAMQQQGVLDKVNEFCKTQALNLAVVEGAKRISSGDTETILDLIKEAQRVGVRRDYGINFWEEQEEWMGKTSAMSGSIKTGWNLLDDNIGGGFSWGELEIVVSPSGGGKSLAMANLGLSFSLRGYNVVYFTLELAQELVGKRIFSMQTGIPYRELKGRIENAVKVADNMKKKIKGNIGMFRLVNLPQRSTITDIDSYIREMETQFGRQFQIIIIDYADLMGPRDKRIDPNNINLTGKYIIEELRGWCKDIRTANGLPTLCITASQVGKDSMSEMDLNMNNLSGSAWKINTADLIFSVRTNKVMRENGKYEIKILKNRNGGGLDNTFKISYDPSTLLIGDIEEMSESKMKAEARTENTEHYNDVVRSLGVNNGKEMPAPVQPQHIGSSISPKYVQIGQQPMVMVKRSLDESGNETLSLINNLVKSQQ